ncbi:hypothetical protein HYC85_002584 [Camellia sinensis]|uniref:Uncharacterized protein n=1 Tax=Camellia sinensis TaxID=4442 RepID=A0A7J7I956_CAMSI|nr:hypothetical protein HYC85_002584 [Camellia sinensis]
MRPLKTWGLSAGPEKLFVAVGQVRQGQEACRQSPTRDVDACGKDVNQPRSVRFTQQLVLFAPQAVTVHSHVQTLLLTLSSRQPTLRHLAVSTLRHLIEKDLVSN